MPVLGILLSAARKCQRLIINCTFISFAPEIRFNSYGPGDFKCITGFIILSLAIIGRKLMYRGWKQHRLMAYLMGSLHRQSACDLFNSSSPQQNAHEFIWLARLMKISPELLSQCSHHGVSDTVIRCWNRWQRWHLTIHSWSWYRCQPAPDRQRACLTIHPFEVHETQIALVIMLLNNMFLFFTSLNI